MAYDRKAAMAQLQKQTRDNYQNKDTGNFTSVLKPNLPLWKCGEGKHQLDIIPFVVGKGYPEAWEPKSYAYLLNIWTHYNVGANDGTYLCLNAMFKQDCPVCEYRKQLQDEGADKETADALKPKRYTLYNVVCYDSPAEEAKGVQIWNVSYHLMERYLLAIADASGELVPYADSDLGKRILFNRKGSGAKNTQYLGHVLADRVKNGKKYVISDATLNKAYSLDECVIIPTYEEVADALFGKRSSTRGQSIGGARTSVNTEDDVPESVEEVPAPSMFRTMSRKALKDYIEENNLAIDPDDFDTKSELIDAVIALLSGDEGNGGEEVSASEGECPHKGGIFGKMFDEYDECPDCGSFSECAAAHDVIVEDVIVEEKKKGIVRRGTRK